MFDRLAGGLDGNPNQALKLFEIYSVQRLTADIPDVESGQIVYFMAPTVQNLVLLVTHVRTRMNDPTKSAASFSVIFYPQKLYHCDVYLEREGLWGDLKTFDLGSSFVPIDKDVWSLEAPFVFENLFLENDLSWVGTIAKCLLTLQTQEVFGCFSKICGIGKYSSMIHECLLQMQQVHGQTKKPGAISDIHTLVIIDRDVDYITPLMTPLTYEAALDEVYGLKCGNVKIPPKPGAEDQKPKCLVVNSVRNPELNEVRDLHLSVALKHMRSMVDRLQEGEKKVSNISNVSTLKDFVDKLPDHLKEKSFLTTHFELLGNIIEIRGTHHLIKELQIEHSLVQLYNQPESLSAIEDILSNAFPSDLPHWSDCLRLIALASLTMDGLPKAELNRFQLAAFSTFGPEMVHSLKKMELAGLIAETGAVAAVKQFVSNAAKPQTVGSWSYKTALKKLPLPPAANFNAKMAESPTEPSYIFNGAYVPTSVRLVEYFLSLPSGQAPAEDMASYLRYKPFVHEPTASVRGANSQLTAKWPKSALICFVGGASYTEVAALRLLGKRKNCQIAIATTAMINGRSFMKQFKFT